MSNLPARLSVVTLGVHDLPRQRDFYRALGFTISQQIGDGFCAFLVGGVVLSLFPVDQLAEEAAPDAEPPAGGWSGVTLAINVDDRDAVDPAFAAAVAAGATVIAEPVDRVWGGRSGYIADPEGNRWEIVWATGVEFDDRGAVTRFAAET